MSSESEPGSNAEGYAAMPVPPAGDDANREETPGPRRRIVAMEARVFPNSYGVFPESEFIFFGSCVNEGTRRSGAFYVRFEVDGSPYGPDILVDNLDVGAYTEVNVRAIPGTLAPGEHLMSVLFNTDFVIERPDPMANKLNSFMFRVSEPET